MTQPKPSWGIPLEVKQYPAYREGHSREFKHRRRGNTEAKWIGDKDIFKANLLAVSKACRGEGHFFKQISWQEAKHAGIIFLMYSMPVKERAMDVTALGSQQRGLNVFIHNPPQWEHHRPFMLLSCACSDPHELAQPVGRTGGPHPVPQGARRTCHRHPGLGGKSGERVPASGDAGSLRTLPSRHFPERS